MRLRLKCGNYKGAYGGAIVRLQHATGLFSVVTVDQARLNQLTSWIDEPTSPVRKEVAGMVLRRQIFGQFMDIWYEAPDVVAESGGEFAHWVRWIYRDAQAHAIRR